MKAGCGVFESNSVRWAEKPREREEIMTAPYPVKAGCGLTDKDGKLSEGDVLVFTRRQLLSSCRRKI